MPPKVVYENVCAREVHHQTLAYLSGASEGYFVNVLVAGNGCPCRGAKPWDDVHNSRRELCLK